MQKSQFEREETYSEEETVARREATLKRLLATPHKPQKAKGNTSGLTPMKARKPKASKP